MPDYKVKTTFALTGHFIINAPSRTDAREMVERRCHMSKGVIHSTLPDEELVDWEFPADMDKTVTRVLSGPKAVKPAVINRNKAPRRESYPWQQFQRACKSAQFLQGAGGPETKAAYHAMLQVEGYEGMNKKELISAAWKIFKGTK